MQAFNESSRRSLVVFTGYLGLAAAAVLFALLTVNRRGEDELRNGFTHQAYDVVTFWQTHGYFASAGIAAFPIAAGPNAQFGFYTSLSGGWYVPALIVENIAQVIEGRYDWRLVARAHLTMGAVTAALLALLCYRLASRFGISALHAFCLGACVLAVHFTFPDVQFFYWVVSQVEVVMPFYVMFLLLYDGVIVHERLRRIVQALVVFGMVYVDHTTAIPFLASFFAVHFVLERGALHWREWLAWIAAPAAAAILLFALQLLILHVRYPSVPRIGSSFMFRSGLDGDTRYYRTHMDILYGRDLARANYTHNLPQLFRWPALFIAGLTSLMAMLFLYVHDRLSRSAFVVLVTLTGCYVLFAAVFSQGTVIHPMYYDYVIATPMMLALFGLLPAAGEALTKNKGVFVLLSLFAAAWYAMVNLRDYVLWFPRV